MKFSEIWTRKKPRGEVPPWLHCIIWYLGFQLGAVAPHFLQCLAVEVAARIAAHIAATALQVIGIFQCPLFITIQMPRFAALKGFAHHAFTLCASPRSCSHQRDSQI
jgi:hypothetical protein